MGIEDGRQLGGGAAGGEAMKFPGLDHRSIHVYWEKKARWTKRDGGKVPAGSDSTGAAGDAQPWAQPCNSLTLLGNESRINVRPIH